MSSNNPRLNDFQTAEAWKSEIERSTRVAENYWPHWLDNLNYYIGKSPDATAENAEGNNWVNVNADFYNVELKLAQLFFDTPQLNLSSKGEFKPQPPAATMPGAPPQPQPNAAPIVGAHRELLNELLGPSHADALTTIQKAIKDCLLTAGVGATKISYSAAMMPLQPPVAQPGAILGLSQPMDSLQAAPVDEQWSWDRIPSKKFRIPADFKDTDFDKAPWLAMDFRMPLTQAKRDFNLPADYEGTKDRDEKVLNDRDVSGASRDASAIPYIDGTEIWYYGYIFDPDVINPKLIRRHVVVDGVDDFVEKDNTNPYQELLPNGRLSADSMIGYPIHVLTLRSVPDSPFVPSDSSMTRPLVRELCKFRSQQVQERDSNLPRFLYDSSKLTPPTVTKITNGTIGAMIPVMEDALQQGVDKIMVQVTQGSQTRGSYAANDYIQRDLEKTLGIDATGTGVKDSQSSTATEIAVIDRQRNVRIDGERRQVLAWYLKGVEKFSALVARFMTPALAVPYIGQEQAQAWAGWDKKQWDGRFVFGAKPDSQIKLDAAAERKYALDLYQFLARDPNVNRVALLKNLVEKANLDPGEIIVEQLPEKKPDIALSLALKGDDFLGPQAQQVREVLAQAGIQITDMAVQTTATQHFQQMQLGIRDGMGQAVKPASNPASHGGVAEKVRPLDQQSADQSGQRPGAKPMVS